MTKKKTKQEVKKDNYLIIFCKAFITGLGVIFPISASSLAISLGIYERLLHLVNNLKTELKNEWKFLLTFIIGVVLSMLTSCLLVKVTYDKYPIATLLFFEGLIIGGFPSIFKKTNKEYKFKNIIWGIIGIVLLVSVSFIGGGQDAVMSSSALGLLTAFGVGALAAGTMVIPGVSGSLILVIIGYYKPMLDIISNIVHFENLGTNILIAGCFGIGMIVGILIVSKLMEFFLNKFERKTYFAINGFVLASIVNVFILIFKENFSLVQTIIGAVLFIISFFVSFKLLKEE